MPACVAIGLALSHLIGRNLINVGEGEYLEASPIGPTGGIPMPPVGTVAILALEEE
jgi:hypothetical protein